MFHFLIETVRRLMAVVAVLGGIWLVFWPASGLVFVRLVDFERDFELSPYYRAKDESVADFMRHRTEGRSRVEEGEAWRAFLVSLQSGAPAGALQRLDRARGRVEWVFPEEALPALSDGGSDVFSYLSIPSQKAWISLDRKPAQDVLGLESRFVYPQRKFGFLFIGFGFLAYFLLPRRKRADGALAYARGASVLGPDLLGLLGGGFFFALPVLVIGENAPGQLPWASEGGWHFLTFALWTMSLLFLSLLAVGLFYATLSLIVTDRGLVVRRGGGQRTYAWDEMEGCEDYRSQRGKVLGFLLVVLANSPGMVGQGLLVASNQKRGLEIRMKGGASLKVMANSFPGYSVLVEELRMRGICGADTLEN